MVKELLLRGADPTVTHPISNFTLLHHLAECHGSKFEMGQIMNNIVSLVVFW